MGPRAIAASERQLIPTASSISHPHGVTLLDVLDRVIDKGVVVKGEVFLQVADIELINLELQLVLASSERLRPGGRYRRSKGELEQQRAELHVLERNLRKVQYLVPTTMSADSPQKAEHALAKLVLTLVELIRKLMERQAVRRMSGGSLTAVEIERLGLTFQALERKMVELKQVFGIKDHELQLELGPLGNLV